MTYKEKVLSVFPEAYADPRAKFQETNWAIFLGEGLSCRLLGFDIDEDRAWYDATYAIEVIAVYGWPVE